MQKYKGKLQGLYDWVKAGNLEHAHVPDFITIFKGDPPRVFHIAIEFGYDVAHKMATSALLVCGRLKGSDLEEHEVHACSMVAKDILQNYKVFSLSDIVYMVQKGMQGQYSKDGVVYRIDYNTMHNWLRQYKEERRIELKRFKEIQRSATKALPSGVDFSMTEEVKKRNEELYRKLGEFAEKMDAKRKE